jgi:hypothetical protein|tara:strand:- start:30613 stop:30768 length:156 start_codon:yes stop_codon:yes gene_type:complete
MKIEKTEILEMYWTHKKCEKRIKDARSAGLPNNTNIGCVEVKGLSKAKRTL